MHMRRQRNHGPCPPMERCRHLSNTWMHGKFQGRGRVIKDVFWVMRMFNEIQPSQRGQSQLLWAGWTWEERSRESPLSTQLPSARDQLYSLALRGNGFSCGLEAASERDHRETKFLLPLRPLFPGLPRLLAWGTSKITYIRVKYGMQANICNQD